MPMALLTGAGGFIGTQVARRIIADTDYSLTVLVRGSDMETAKRRLLRAWWPWPELGEKAGSRITVIAGDIRQPKLGLGEESFQKLAADLSCIIHTAADLRLNGPLEEMTLTNVKGTEHLLQLATAAHEDHGIGRFAFVSTAYVAGRRKGEIREESLFNEAGFANTYEQTKFEAERNVADAGQRFPVTILRPGMVVGDSESGAITVFNTLYYPLQLYLSGQLRAFPASSSLRIAFVPVDYVANAIARLAFDTRAKGKTFHLVAPASSSPTARELVDFVQDWAATHLASRLPHVLFVPLPGKLMRGICTFFTRSGIGSRRMVENIAELAPYLSESKQFLRTNTDTLLGEYVLDWRVFLPRLLQFATYHGFLHCAPRTVHEQIIKRLSGKSRHITFRDIGPGRMRTYRTSDVRDEMVRASDALSALGVRPGDRVAVVGTNSTRYLTVDVAIGLAGAVSVPLYVTSPPEEIHRIITQCEARVLFVGEPNTLKRVTELQMDIPIVQFSHRQRNDDSPQVLTWESFLERGKRNGTHVRMAAPVGFDDMATIRYSSGTTGSPRGAVFTHGQLRWMGEAIAALPSWKARNRRISYVSFLPMNHVVEGILAMYSPYYAPAQVNLLFVEDLGQLPKALKQGRPTVFFSVPRVYEKLWEHLKQSRSGRRYLIMKNGRFKQVARGLVRTAFLRRAAFNRCGLFIVGSAPVSSALLKGFRDLGIEVHNAYGLTEAPLVTINRMGTNRIGTVGEPLPNTTVEIDRHGRIRVQGPQVATSYFGAAKRDLLVNGFLATGDVGYVTREGSLVLTGRASDMIVTSYGKSVHPEPVEALLKKIQAVDEALLVGEGRPFCAAILWVAPNQWTPQTAGQIKHAMGDLERHLPAPARPKRWVILENDLTIEAGDLTPNFKVRRRSVLARHAQVVASLYREGSAPRNVLGIGELDVQP